MVSVIFFKLAIAGITFFGSYGIVLLLTKENFVNSYIFEEILKNKFWKRKENNK